MLNTSENPFYWLLKSMPKNYPFGTTLTNYHMLHYDQVLFFCDGRRSAYSLSKQLCMCLIGISYMKNIKYMHKSLPDWAPQLEGEKLRVGSLFGVYHRSSIQSME